MLHKFGHSTSESTSKLHHWFNSYGDFAEFVNLAYWWSCIGKGLRQQPVQHAIFFPFTFSLNFPTRPIQSLSPNVRKSYVVPLHEIFTKAFFRRPVSLGVVAVLPLPPSYPPYSPAPCPSFFVLMLLYTHVTYPFTCVTICRMLCIFALHCLLYTVYSALFTLHCLLCTVYFALFTMHCLLCTVYSVRFLLRNVYFALFTLPCLFSIVYSESWTLQCLLCICYYALFTLLCLFYTMNSVLFTLHCSLRTFYSLLFSLHCLLSTA